MFSLQRLFARIIQGRTKSDVPEIDSGIGPVDMDSRLADLKQAQAKAHADLEEQHKIYKAKISPGPSAASLEFAALLLAMCRLTAPRRVIDLGSGFTSYVLRLYQQEAAESVECFSVDDSPEWLSRTREFLEQEGLSTDGLFDWDAYETLQDYAFDLVVLDIHPIARRVELLPKLVEAGTNSGLILVDDVHKPHLRKPVLDMVAENAWLCASLKSQTYDNYGRYAYLVSRKRSL